MHRSIACRSLVLAFALSGATAEAASFDCRQARFPAERTICSHDNLGRLDEQTAGLYFLITGSGGPADTLARVRTSQTAFLKNRDACGAQVDCLVDAYTSQIMLLKTIKGDLGL